MIRRMRFHLGLCLGINNICNKQMTTFNFYFPILRTLLLRFDIMVAHLKKTFNESWKI